MAMRFFIPFLSVPAAALLDKGKLGMMVEQAGGLLRLKKITLRVFSVSIYTISSLRAPIYVREMLHSRGERFTLLFISSLAPLFLFLQSFSG